ncbi:MAG: hypothetical protein FWF12_07670 [Betaproteobacteria bacterium]|nr:hypothetical protein [Betaproteobacteria bacterium]
MSKPIFYLYIGAERLQAAWSKQRGAELHMLFDAGYASGDAAPMISPKGLSAGAMEAMTALVGMCEAETALGQGVDFRVLVSDQWAPSASVPWSASQYRSSAAIAEALGELRETGHDVASAGLIRVDDAPLRQPRLAVCYPAPLLEFVDQLSTALRTRPRSIMTLSALAWRGRDEPAPMPVRPERVLAIVESGNQVILVRGQRSSACIDEVVIRPLQRDDVRLPAERGLPAAVAAIVQRLGWDAEPLPEKPDAASFSVIDLTASDPLTGVTGPLAWWVKPEGRRDVASAHPLDAVARLARPSLFKLFVLAAVVGSAAWLSVVLWRSEERLQSALAKVSAAERVVNVPAAPPPSMDQIKRIAAVNAVIADLNVPLPRLLRALQAPEDIRVALLGLELVAARERVGGAGDIRSSRPTLKILAEAPSSRDMTRYVAYLADRKPLSQAYLVRHEAPDSAEGAMSGGRAAYRFTVEVVWND